MCDSFLIKGKKMLKNRILTKNVQNLIKNNKTILVFVVFLVCGLMLKIWNVQSVLYAHAYTLSDENIISEIQSPLFSEQPDLFPKNDQSNQLFHAKSNKATSLSSDDFANKLYEIVGEAPIKEMIPFISKRNEKVAAFLVGIAKKESGFGEHSPSLNGQDCYNYWGYKGSASNGSFKGYACFGSAEEAIKIVGDRIEVLVSKDHNTPALMVNTWKCGKSCAGDPGAPGWVSTVASCFEKIVT